MRHKDESEEEVLNPFLDGIKGFGDPFVPCECLAIVRRQSMNTGAEGGQQGDHGVRDDLGSLGRYMCKQRIAGLSFIERNESLSMTGTDNKIGFPVAEALATIDNGRTLVNRHLIGDGAAPVGVDALIDGFVADTRLAIGLEVTGDLLGAPQFAELGFGKGPCLRANAAAVLTGPHAGL